MAVTGGLGLPLFASTSGNQARKFDGCASFTGVSSVRVRLRRCASSSLWRSRLGLSGSGSSGAQVAAPAEPRDDEMRAMWMSGTGLNSSLPTAHLPSVESPITLPATSMHLGPMRRSSRSGMAWRRSSCLSPMEPELSIMKSMSTLPLCSSTGVDASGGTVRSSGTSRGVRAPQPAARTTSTAMPGKNEAKRMRQAFADWPARASPILRPPNPPGLPHRGSRSSRLPRSCSG